MQQALVGKPPLEVFESRKLIPNEHRKSGQELSELPGERRKESA